MPRRAWWQVNMKILDGISIILSCLLLSQDRGLDSKDVLLTLSGLL